MFATALCTVIQVARVCSAAPVAPEPLVFGLFIASIEEGGRAFTPVRLLPFDHPDASNHEFPNALVNHTSEVETLVQLGEAAGLRLQNTLLRYPRPPIESWPYPEFAPPPLACIRAARVEHAVGLPKLAGLRALLVMNARPLAFIVDTRALSLRQREMNRPTTMGLDVTRAQFLERLAASVPEGASSGCRMIVTMVN